jgi:hypothetical protein
MNLRPTLPPLPPDMRQLPIDQRGFPVPYFVKWVNGVPDFRILDMEKIHQSTVEGRCQICGKKLGRSGIFAVGPISAITLVDDEPPMHQLCAEFAAQACPWMMRPGMKRGQAVKPDGTLTPAEILNTPGTVYSGAPKVWALIEVQSYYADRQADGTILYHMGQPVEMSWWAEGRRATREQVIDATSDARTYLANHDPSPEAVADLDARMTELGQWLPENWPMERKMTKREVHEHEQSEDAKTANGNGGADAGQSGPTS